MVEWKKLEDVCKVLTGGDAPLDCIKGQTEPSAENPYPVYSNGDEVYGFCPSYRVSEDAVTISSIGNVGSVNYRSANFTPIIRLKVVVPSIPNLKTKYLYYTLLGYRFIGTNSSLSSMKAADIKRLSIPLPSLSEQERIVGILDTFTSSIENLKAQISLRRKQYEHYRDKLLDLEGKEGVEMKTLPEISDNRDRVRKPITSSKRKPGNYPYYGASGIVDYVDGYIFDGDYLLISEDGANLIARSTPIAFSIRGRNWVNNHAHVLQFKDKATQKYVEIYINMIDLEPWINGAAQPKLNQDNLNKIPIPLPPLHEQQRIVSILDTFEASIQNLEAQLEAREKQYEYYREKLLTFERE